MQIVGRKTWLIETAFAAAEAGHLFPQHAACEAALESAYGASQLAREGNNLFGMKQHAHSEYGTISLPTREWSPAHEYFQLISAEWIKYPSVAACFKDRMATLQRLSALYPHYAKALSAGAGDVFVVEVSQTWSTDPRRAQKALAIFDQFFKQEQSAQTFAQGETK